MKTLAKPKLTLNKETVKSLSPGQLRGAQGGFFSQRRGTSCFCSDHLNYTCIFC